MRWPRFRVRTLMTVVALIAVAAGVSIEGVRLSSLARRYRREAAVYGVLEQGMRSAENAALGYAGEQDQWAQTFADVARRLRDEGNDPGSSEAMLSEERARSDAANLRRSAARNAESADFYGGMRQKYQRAASRPWISIPPDPQAPE